MDVVGPAVAGGTAPAIGDDLADVAPWGCRPAQVRAPVLLLRGGLDRVAPMSHARRLDQRERSRNKTTVITAETSREPRQPRRLLKRKNIRRPVG